MKEVNYHCTFITLEILFINIKQFLKEIIHLPLYRKYMLIWTLLANFNLFLRFKSLNFEY
jgi:hypothetical protein